MPSLQPGIRAAGKAASRGRRLLSQTSGGRISLNSACDGKTSNQVTQIYPSQRQMISIALEITVDLVEF